MTEHMQAIIDWERSFNWMMTFGYMTFKKSNEAKEMQKEFMDVGIETKIKSHFGRKFILSLVD